MLWNRRTRSHNYILNNLLHSRNRRVLQQQKNKIINMITTPEQERDIALLIELSKTNPQLRLFLTLIGLIEPNQDEH